MVVALGITVVCSVVVATVLPIVEAMAVAFMLAVLVTLV